MYVYTTNKDTTFFLSMLDTNRRYIPTEFTQIQHQIFHDFPPSLQAYERIVPWIDHFLPILSNSSNSIINLYYSILHNNCSRYDALTQSTSFRASNPGCDLRCIFWKLYERQSNVTSEASSCCVSVHPSLFLSPCYSSGCYETIQDVSCIKRSTVTIAIL
jgi:hypothetical protein